MAAALTPNAVAQMLGDNNLELKPTVQCIGKALHQALQHNPAGVTFKVRAGVKAMTSNAATSAQAERFRLAISDGRYWCTAMLATQLNDMVNTDQIRHNTVIRLDEYLSNAVQAKKYVATLDVPCALHAYRSLVSDDSAPVAGSLSSWA